MLLRLDFCSLDAYAYSYGCMIDMVHLFCVFLRSHLGDLCGYDFITSQESWTQHYVILEYVGDSSIVDVKNLIGGFSLLDVN